MISKPIRALAFLCGGIVLVALGFAAGAIAAVDWTAQQYRPRSSIDNAAFKTAVTAMVPDGMYVDEASSRLQSMGFDCRSHADDGGKEFLGCIRIEPRGAIITAAWIANLSLDQERKVSDVSTNYALTGP